MSYANIITQAARRATVPGGVYGGLDYHGEPTWDVAHAAGWRRLDDRKPFTPPDGLVLTGWNYRQDPERKDYAVEEPTVDLAPVAPPDPADVAEARVLAKIKPLVDALGKDAALTKATQDAAKAVSADAAVAVDIGKDK